MINQGNQIMTKEIRLNVGHIIRYCKLAINRRVYATFSHFFIHNFFICSSHLFLFTSFILII